MRALPEAVYVGAFFAVIAAWFSILFTGRFPRGIFDYVEGVIRWHNRVVAYAWILVTDRYPRSDCVPEPGQPADSAKRAREGAVLAPTRTTSTATRTGAVATTVRPGKAMKRAV